MQAIDKETEQLVKRIEQAVRAAKLRRLSLEEGWRHHLPALFTNVRAGGRE